MAEKFSDFELLYGALNVDINKPKNKGDTQKSKVRKLKKNPKDS